MASIHAINALAAHLKAQTNTLVTSTDHNGYVVNIRTSPSNSEDNCCYLDGISKTLTYDCYTRYEDDPNRINFRTLAEYGVLPSNEVFFSNAKDGDTIMITDDYKGRYLLGVITRVTANRLINKLEDFMDSVGRHLKPYFFERYIIFKPHSMLDGTRLTLYETRQTTDLSYDAKYVVDAVANLTKPKDITGFYRNGWFTRNRPELHADTYTIHNDIMRVTSQLSI